MKGGTPHRLARVILTCQGRIEGSAGFEHGTSDVEEAIGDRSQCAAMTMTAPTQRCVLRATGPVVLHSDTRPVVHGVRQSLVASLSPNDDDTLSGALCDGRDSRQTAQCGVVTSLQGIEGFCKQRGEDDPSHSRQGCEDLRVMLLYLPRLALLRASKLTGQSIEPAMGFGQSAD